MAVEESKIFEGQNVQFIFTVKDQDGAVVDVSLATEMTLYLDNNTTAPVSKTMTHLTDGLDGKVTYTTTTSDLNVGDTTWKAQGKVVIAGNEYPTTIVEFKVHKKIY